MGLLPYRRLAIDLVGGKTPTLDTKKYTVAVLRFSRRGYFSQRRQPPTWRRECLYRFFSGFLSYFSILFMVLE